MVQKIPAIRTHRQRHSHDDSLEVARKGPRDLYVCLSLLLLDARSFNLLIVIRARSQFYRRNWQLYLQAVDAIFSRLVLSAAAGVGGLDAVLAADAAEAAGGDAQGLAGFLIAGVDAGGAFDAVQADFLHIALLADGVGGSSL